MFANLTQGNLFNQQAQNKPNTNIFAGNQQNQGLGSNNQPNQQNLGIGSLNINQPTQNIFSQQQNNPQQNQANQMNLNPQQKQDVENFEQTLNNFIEANSQNAQQQNPLYIFKTPMFNLIPDLKSNPYQAQNYYQYIPNDMNKEVHAELQKKNPDRNRFYLDYLRGWEDLDKRSDQIKKFSSQLIERSGAICKESDDLKQKNSEIFKNKISDLKQKNHLILDKILSVYSLIETIAQRCNNVERKNDEEISLYRNFQDQEGELQNIQQKLQDIQNQQIENQSQDNQKFQDNIGQLEKETLLEQIELLKKGLISQNLSDKNINEFRAFEEVLSQKTGIHNLF